jgi:hypothetical protein
MFEVFDKFTKYFTWDTTDLDNWVWKLYSKASVALCMLAAALCICSTYFGNPMDCHKNEDKFVTQYCWVHGSYKFALAQQEFAEEVAERIGANCIPKDYYDTEADGKPTTAYYQWVIFMLFGHGILFMLPDRIWKFFESGLVNEFVPFKNQDGVIDEEDKKEKAQKFKDLSTSQNKVYLTAFIFCELLNFGAAVVNFVIIDSFLGGKFATYGSDVISYWIDSNNVKEDPMCSTFPTLVSCEYYLGGTNGKLDVRNTICILSQNIINEKIYLFLWFWIMALFGVSTVMVAYRFCTIFVPPFRRYELMYRARKGNSRTIESVGKRISLSQWFILSQIGRNSKSRDFNNFLSHLKPLLPRIQVSSQVNQANETQNVVDLNINLSPDAEQIPLNSNIQQIPLLI